MSTPTVFESTSIAELQALLRTVTLQAEPALADRALRGAALFLAGHVTPDAADPRRFVVAGSEAEPYQVDLGRGADCTCPDFLHRAPTFAAQKWCKHRLAALLWYRLAQRAATRRELAAA